VIGKRKSRVLLFGKVVEESKAWERRMNIGPVKEGRHDYNNRRE